MTSRNLCSTWLPDHLPGTGHDLGFDGTYLRDVLEHWAIDFDWRAAEERLNSFANRTATIDGTALLSIGTWGDLDGSPYTRIGLSVLREVLPAGAVPELEVAFTESVRPGAFEEHLRAVGFRDIAADWFHWDTEYPDFAAWWGYDTGFGPLAPLFSALDDRQQAIAQQVMTDEVAKHRAVSGSYRLPATARVITARC